VARRRTPAETIGDRVRRRRLELGLTQRELAAPGVSYAFVSRIEAGARIPSVKTLRKIAPTLKTTVAWLETGMPDPAEELAEIVFQYRGNPLPRTATVLAKRILGGAR
jgi:transcriptional regulator with XRE-family HTH domain